jgi:hypothetical protein
MFPTNKKEAEFGFFLLAGPLSSIAQQIEGTAHYSVIRTLASFLTYDLGKRREYIHGGLSDLDL